jgi:hypothetical protein
MISNERLPTLRAATVARAAALADLIGVSERARARGGYTWEVIKLGSVGSMPEFQRRRRDGYLTRATDNGKPRNPIVHADGPYRGFLTRYGLALACWAYSPDPAATRRALALEERANRTD